MARRVTPAVSSPNIWRRPIAATMLRPGRIAGRSTDKLQKVRADIGAPDDLPLVKADAAEPASLRSMCERAAVIITTVGPYQLHGPELVAACAATGTAYVDLCGEPALVRGMVR